MPDSSGENMPRKKLNPNEPHVAPQVTLRGLNAYIFLSLVQKRGVEAAEIARWIIDSWVRSEEGKKALAEHGIDPRAYRPLNNVVEISKRGK
jgi:hypothetical protein